MNGIEAETRRTSNLPSRRYTARVPAVPVENCSTRHWQDRDAASWRLRRSNFAGVGRIRRVMNDRHGARSINGKSRACRCVEQALGQGACSEVGW